MTAMTWIRVAGLSCYRLPSIHSGSAHGPRFGGFRSLLSAQTQELLVVGWLDVFWNRRKDQARDLNYQPPATPNTRSGRRGKLPIQVTTARPVLFVTLAFTLNSQLNRRWWADLPPAAPERKHSCAVKFNERNEYDSKDPDRIRCGGANDGCGCDRCRAGDTSVFVRVQRGRKRNHHPWSELHKSGGHT